MQYRSTSRMIFQVLNYLFLFVLCISILVPFINAIAISLSSKEELIKAPVELWPRGFNLDAYKQLTNNHIFVRSFINTVVLAAIQTVQHIICALAAAYALSHKHLPWKKGWFGFILVPMFFSGGLIPFYLLVNGLGLNNTYWALILPSFVSVSTIIIFKNVIDQLPKELMESAEMDGTGEIRMLFRIVLPLVLPMTMAFTIFNLVGYWNDWFNVLLFIRDNTKWTLQFQLRDILVNAALVTDKVDALSAEDKAKITPENLKMAALMITVLPIIAVYPFMQRFFIHGQLVGAVKG